MLYTKALKEESSSMHRGGNPSTKTLMNTDASCLTLRAQCLSLILISHDGALQHLCS